MKLSLAISLTLSAFAWTVIAKDGTVHVVLDYYNVSISRTGFVCDNKHPIDGLHETNLQTCDVALKLKLCFINLEGDIFAPADKDDCVDFAKPREWRKLWGDRVGAPRAFADAHCCLAKYLEMPERFSGNTKCHSGTTDACNDPCAAWESAVTEEQLSKIDGRWYAVFVTANDDDGWDAADELLIDAQVSAPMPYFRNHKVRFAFGRPDCSSRAKRVCDYVDGLVKPPVDSSRLRFAIFTTGVLQSDVETKLTFAALLENVQPDSQAHICKKTTLLN